MPRCIVMGFGSSGERHASMLRARFPDDEILIYSSRAHPEVGLYVTSSLEDVAGFCPEIAVIAGVATQRLTMLEALAPSVRGLMIEKPLATSYVKAIELTVAIKKRSWLTQVGYNLRYSPSLREFKRRVDECSLGEVQSIRIETGHFLPSWRPLRDYRNTASATKELGGGALLELSHEIDYLRWIFGDFEWVSAWFGNSSHLEIDVEDTVHLIVGIAARNRENPLIAQVNLDFVRHDRTRRVTAVCSEGSIQWDGNSCSVREFSPAVGSWQTVYVEQPGSSSSYELQLESFLSAVDKGLAPDVSIYDGLAVLSLIEAAITSQASGGVRVPVEREGLPS